jgi:hypothetical protein
MTMISVATPNRMPRKEKPAITEINPSRLFERRYLPATILSKAKDML